MENEDEDRVELEREEVADLPGETINFLELSEMYMDKPTERDFSEHFGLHPVICAAVWFYLTVEKNEDQEVNNIYIENGIQAYHLLWWLYWVKTYNTQSVCAKFCKTSRPTWREKTDVIEDLLLGLDVIDWVTRFMGDIGCHAKTTVDCTDCPLQEVSPFDRTLWSFKINAAGARYEIGVCIQTGLIVWVNGPYNPGPWPDLRIFRDRLIHELAIGEWVVADAGYRDGFQFVIPKQTGPSWLQMMTAAGTARHETVNGRIKVFGCLKVPFRHGMERHGRVFKAICNVVQISLQINGPTYTINYDDRYLPDIMHYWRMIRDSDGEE